MKYGLELANGGAIADPATLAALAQEAEIAGWDGIFLEDYIVWQGHADAPTYDPMVLLAAMAMRTTRVRLGTTVTSLSRRRPWKLAKEAVTLDHLSNGRLILGIGLGDVGDQGFAAVREVMPLAKRATIVDEALELLTLLWSGEPVTFHGRHFTVDHLPCLPRPLQQPRIPIWIGGKWPTPGVMRRAATYDGFVGGKVHRDDEDWRLDAPEIHDLKDRIRATRASLERFDIALGGARPGEDIAEDRRYVAAAEAAGATWWMEYANDELGGIDLVREFVRRGPLPHR